MITTKMKLIAGIVSLVVLAWAVTATRLAYEYNLEVNRLVDAVRIASKQPSLKRGDAAEQIQALALSIRTIGEAAARCSTSVNTLGDAGARQQREADTRLDQTAALRQEARTSARRLEESARQPPVGACLSDELKRRWM